MSGIYAISVMHNHRLWAHAFRAQGLYVSADLTGRSGVLIWDDRKIWLCLKREAARVFAERVAALVHQGISRRDATQSLAARLLRAHLQKTLDLGCELSADPGCTDLFLDCIGAIGEQYPSSTTQNTENSTFMHSSAPHSHVSTNLDLFEDGVDEFDLRVGM